MRIFLKHVGVHLPGTQPKKDVPSGDLEDPHNARLSTGRRKNTLFKIQKYEQNTPFRGQFPGSLRIMRIPKKDIVVRLPDTASLKDTLPGD